MDKQTISLDPVALEAATHALDSCFSLVTFDDFGTRASAATAIKTYLASLIERGEAKRACLAGDWQTKPPRFWTAKENAVPKNCLIIRLMEHNDA